jgi:ribonucleoside-diphosphate reductase subunit M1
MSNTGIKIVDRQGNEQDLNVEKIIDRIQKLVDQYRLDQCNVSFVVWKVLQNITNFTTTTEVDTVSANVCIDLSPTQRQYKHLGSLLALDNHRRNVQWSFSDAMELLYTDGLIPDDVMSIVRSHTLSLEREILQPDRDYLIDFHGFKTLENSYLLKTRDHVIRETPQYMFLRVAIGIHKTNSENLLHEIKETYDLMSTLTATHATPTLFNAGTRNPNFASCFLLGTADSVRGIYKTVGDCAEISKWAGGIGVHISNIRSNGAYISGTGGHSEGLLNMMKVYNATARHINQGSKRKGSFALYLEPWHADIFAFLTTMLKHGDEEQLCRDLYTGLWIPDLFMKAVIDNKDWYLMCPNECPGLTDTYGPAFELLYEQYVDQHKYRKKIKARDLWMRILRTQVESGMPYMLFKDHCNKKSNQNNVGTIKSSNLCAEIIEYSDDQEYAVCTLASISLPKHVYISKYSNITNFTLKLRSHKYDFVVLYLEDMGLEQNRNLTVEYDESMSHDVSFFNGGSFWFVGFEKIQEYFTRVCCKIDYSKLEKTVNQLVKNLNVIIDTNYYPVSETERSNNRLRPLGIGVQGLANVFSKFWLPYTSKLAKSFNKRIFEAIYYYALKASCELAKKDGPYEKFAESPLSRGFFQFHLWNSSQTNMMNVLKSFTDPWSELSIEEHWEPLQKSIIRHGVRNSLLVALMPTASTAQIMGNTESFEPLAYNFYERRTLSGNFIVINEQLMRILEKLKLWTKEIQEQSHLHAGSIASIESIPPEIREIFKTTWELKKKALIDMSADRGAFVCQSQSFNCFVEDTSYDYLTKMYIYAWKRGLKTGLYYLRTKPSVNPQAVTVAPKQRPQQHQQPEEEDVCISCSS